jgi:Coatomer beta subunit appendage platform
VLDALPRFFLLSARVRYCWGRLPPRDSCADKACCFLIGGRHYCNRQALCIYLHEILCGLVYHAVETPFTLTWCTVVESTHLYCFFVFLLLRLLFAFDSVFGEDALVNVSVEKKDDNDGKLAGYIRIRSKTQGIALSLGDRITSVQRGLPENGSNKPQ